MNWQEFSGKYCETQEQTPEGLLEILRDQADRFGPDGWMILEFIDMCSSRCGQHVILPFGPNNTLKSPPDGIVHPYGLASDSAEVRGVLLRKDLPSKAPGGHIAASPSGGTNSSGSSEE